MAESWVKSVAISISIIEDKVFFILEGVFDDVYPYIPTFRQGKTVSVARASLLSLTMVATLVLLSSVSVLVLVEGN